LQREWEEEAMWEEEDAWEEEAYSGGYYGMGVPSSTACGGRGEGGGGDEGAGDEGAVEEDERVEPRREEAAVVLSPPRACAWGSPAGGGLTLADQLAGRSIPSSPAEGEGLAVLEAAMAAMGCGGDAKGKGRAWEGDLAAEEGEAQVCLETKSEGCSDPDTSTCPICREEVVYGRYSRIPVCGHEFCAGCILSWASYKPDACCCPVCRVGFSRLVTYRHLDGEFSTVGVSESVALLLRAQWFELPVECSAGISGKRRAQAPWGAPEDADAFVYEWDEEDDPLYWPTDEMYADEERDLAPVSIGGGGNVRSRLLSNRPFGANGYMSMGRQLARPTPRRRGAGKKPQAVVDRRAGGRTGAGTSASAAEATPDGP